MNPLLRALSKVGNMNENPKLIHLRNRVVMPLGKFVSKSGLTATALNYLGLVLGFVAAAFIAGGNFTLGFIFFLLSGLSDMLDGAVARATDVVSDFGAFQDSVIDRYVDTFIFLGISLYYIGEEKLLLTVVTYFALLGSYITSYAAARAGSLGIFRYIGFMGRPQRVILLILGIGYPALLNMVMWLLAILGNITAIHRSAFYLTQLRKKQTP